MFNFLIDHSGSRPFKYSFIIAKRLVVMVYIMVHFIRAGDVGGSVQSVSRMKLREQSHGWHSSVGNSTTCEHLPTRHSI